MGFLVIASPTYRVYNNLLQCMYNNVLAQQIRGLGPLLVYLVTL
jgi:hypothetical protein